MNVARTAEEVRGRVAEARHQGRRIGFVPTMGYLHEGHLSLIDLVRARGAELVVASIFVNPLQFGPAEDFDRYPRDEDRDRALLEQRGTDLLFAPARDALVPDGGATRVVVGGPAEPLEGERRPGHFNGVATIVAKLFNIIAPDLAAFGQKDAQQVAVIRRMVRDLDIPVELVVGETRREPDGLALSSRNAYLTPEQRKVAPVLHRALRAGRAALDAGGGAATVEASMREVVTNQGDVEIDYLRLVDAETFDVPRDLDRDLVLAGAIRLGSTRLIDNIPVPRRTS